MLKKFNLIFVDQLEASQDIRTCNMPIGMCKILPGLYLGSLADAQDEEQLSENGITHIVSVLDKADPIFKDKKYLCIETSDMPGSNLMTHFGRSNKFIHDARLRGGTVLVHCFQGVSRSTTIVVAYLITVTNHSWMDALSAVKHARSIAKPNFGFTNQLKKYQRERIKKERDWIKRAYPNTDNGEDQQLLAEMCRKYCDSNAT